MGRIDKLAERYRRHVALPWQKDLAGAERAIFVVYDKADERPERPLRGHVPERRRQEHDQRPDR